MNAPERLPADPAAQEVIKPEEHDRSKYIGGSDIAVILGISPWRTPLQLWQDKRTPRVDGPRKQVFTRGIRWEAVVGEMLVERLEYEGHKVQIVAANRRYKDADHPFLASEIDFELILDDGDEITNCELKTVHPFKAREWGDSGTDNLPTHYTAQVMHGLGVTRRRKGILAALFGADELRTYPVDADDETIAALRQRAVSFWHDHVLANVPPPPVNAEDLAKLYPRELEGGEPLLADPDLAEKVMRLRAIAAEVRAREAEGEAIEFEIKRAMRDCVELLMPNGKSAIEWKLRSGKFIDESRLKEEQPAVFKAFQKTWESRVFKLKSFDTKGI